MPSDMGTFRGIRSSKFRHIYGKSARKEHCYENILLTRKIHDAPVCAVNPKFIALAVEVAGGGAFIVLPLERTGRIDVCTPKVAGHTGALFDLKWSPFNDNLIASASDDCHIKIWHIPDGGLKANVSEPLISLTEHKRRVTLLEWHPTVDAVLFSVALDFNINIWNTTKGTKLRTINSHSDIIYSLSIDRNGSRLATTCRDKKLRVIDPLSGNILQETICHSGPKMSKAVYIGDTGIILTTGFSRFSDRQMSFWNEKDLRTPLKTETIDSSSGVLTPYYDHDTKLVFLAGKGDGNVRYYEITETPPYCHYLNQFISSEPQRGFAIMPKRGCVTSKCEFARFYKLHASKSICEPISMIVPRKSEQFQPDIFPDTAAPSPALSVDEWLSGQIKPPVLMSMKTGLTIKTHRPVPRRPSDITSDKHADKKFAFLNCQTRPDYRPMQMRSKSFVAYSDKDLKTSANLDTKFQHLQRIWGCKPALALQNALNYPNGTENRIMNLSLKSNEEVDLNSKSNQSTPVDLKSSQSKSIDLKTGQSKLADSKQSQSKSIDLMPIDQFKPTGFAPNQTKPIDLPSDEPSSVELSPEYRDRLMNSWTPCQILRDRESSKEITYKSPTSEYGTKILNYVSPCIYEKSSDDYRIKPFSNENELRKAYSNQCEEMRLMKLQMIAKERRIIELEDVVLQLRTSIFSMNLLNIK